MITSSFQALCFQTHHSSPRTQFILNTIPKHHPECSISLLAHEKLHEFPPGGPRKRGKGKEKNEEKRKEKRQKSFKQCSCVKRGNTSTPALLPKLLLSLQTTHISIPQSPLSPSPRHHSTPPQNYHAHKISTSILFAHRYIHTYIPSLFPRPSSLVPPLTTLTLLCS